MIARVAAFEGINVDRVHKTMDEAEAVVGPMVEALPGYEGRLDLAAADGRYLSITLFDSEEHALAAEATFEEEMPRLLGEIFASWGGRRLSVDLLEVVTSTR
jgi:hypothetical protein